MKHVVIVLVIIVVLLMFGMAVNTIVNDSKRFGEERGEYNTTRHFINNTEVPLTKLPIVVKEAALKKDPVNVYEIVVSLKGHDRTMRIETSAMRYDDAVEILRPLSDRDIIPEKQ